MNAEVQIDTETAARTLAQRVVEFARSKRYGGNLANALARGFVDDTLAGMFPIDGFDVTREIVQRACMILSAWQRARR